jgi:twitching motility protein PilT
VARIDAIFKLVKDQGASDLHLTSGSPPILRQDGDIQAIEYQPLSSELLTDLLKEMMSPDLWARFEEEHEVDFGYEVQGVLRVRANVFRQRRGIAGAFRILPSQIFTLEQLGLPESLTQFTRFAKGLVVVTGPPGSGKSSTQAALIDHINRTEACHIITLEDPVEYIHENKLCLLNQREIGRHTRSFASGLRAALRQDPNIVLVGEMRDLETIELAITAAETGQLVFGTLHTSSAPQTIDRLIDAFDTARQEQVRAMLSESLQGVVAQRLVRRKDGQGRVPALEILVGTPAVRALIREAKTFQIPSVMQTGRRDGQLLMDDHLKQLVKADVITVEEATRWARRKDVLWGMTDDAA